VVSKHYKRFMSHSMTFYLACWPFHFFFFGAFCCLLVCFVIYFLILQLAAFLLSCMNVVALFLLFNKLVIVHVLKFLSFICVCAKVVVVRVYILFEDV